MSKITHDEFSCLLSRPSLQLTDVLLSSSLMTEVRAENAKLFDFLEQDSIIAELAEWCFTSKHKDNPKFIEISEISVSVLLSTNTMIQFLLENVTFARILHDFLISDDSKISRLCGHFTRVISAQIKWDAPLLFIDYPDVQNLLLNRINVLAIRELISTIIFSNIDIINSEQMIEDLSKLADVNSDLDATNLLVLIFKMALPESDVLYFFNRNIVLNHLVSVAVKTASPIIQSDILNCLYSIQFQPSMVNDQNLIEKMTISEDNINDLTISAIDFMQIPMENLISLFFSKNATERLHKKILSQLEEMNLYELAGIANMPNFVINLINAFETDRWCPHCLQIAIYFISIENCCKPLKSKKWRTFIYKKAYPIIKILNHQYGGHVPLPFEENPVEDSSDDEDSNSDENQNIQFEEEEEFYDCNCFCYEEDGANVENIENSDDDVEYEIDV